MHWLNYHHLYYFREVVREGSFTKAALKLRIAQSAVSSQVSQLEEFLGKKLLLRSTSKKLALTEEGELVFGQAEEIFRQGEEVVSLVRGDLLKKSLRIGAIGSLSKNLQLQFLEPILRDPNLALTIDVGDSDALLDRLFRFEIDAILCDVPYAHSHNGKLLQREIAKEKLCLIGRKVSSRQSSLKERLEKNGLYLPARSNPLTGEVEAFLNAQKIRPLVKGHIDDIALLRLLALETDALIAIPKVGASRELKSKELFLHHEFRGLYQSFYFVLRSRGERSQKILQLLRQS